MAENLIGRSPLQNFSTRFSGLPETARIDEEPFTAMVDLWVDPGAAGGTAAAGLLGIEALPTTPSTVTDSPDATVMWFGPQEWLVCSASQDGGELEARLRAAVAEHGGAAVDVSAQRTTVRLRGAYAREVLAKGSSLDLHPSVFGTGMAAQTMLAQANVVLIPLSDNGTDYRIIARSSFAGYLAEWLIDATEEFAATH
jgi:sarcosine oxidase subunit gamma